MVGKKVKKSFAEYEGKTDSGKYKRDCWSDKNKLMPQDVAIQSNKKFWFNCDKCNHEFESQLCNTTLLSRWCPYCSKKKLCSKKDCQHCYKKSFASYNELTSKGNKKTHCWSDKNELKPRDVFIRSGKKYLFDCDVCNHEFESSLLNITAKTGKWCPYCCTPLKKLCSNEYCKHCHNNSFASYEGKTLSGKKKVDCWSSKNENKQRGVFLKSGKKVWFDCDVCGNEFESQVRSITTMGSWCPNCKNKTELKLLNWVKNCDLIISVKKEYAPVWCSTKYIEYNVKKDCINKGKYQYRFDFLITIRGKKNIIIELDGRQHYEQVMNWKAPFCQQIRDKYKEMKANQKNIPVIRILQEDVWSDKNNWQKKLEDKIKTYMEV